MANPSSAKASPNHRLHRNLNYSSNDIISKKLEESPSVFTSLNDNAQECFSSPTVDRDAEQGLLSNESIPHLSLPLEDAPSNETRFSCWGKLWRYPDSPSLVQHGSSQTDRRKALVLVVALGMLFLSVVLLLPWGIPKPPKIAPLTVLISLDGFRNEYLHRGITPSLKRLADNGLMAKSMIPSFPSITFPNHYTLVTGRYPSEHGIVSNTFFDPALNRTFDYKEQAADEDHRFWKGAEPIWVTAAKQGVRTGMVAWPGSSAAHLMSSNPSELPVLARPALWTHYRNWTVEERFALTASWIELPTVLTPRHNLTRPIGDGPFGPVPVDSDVSEPSEILVGGHIFPAMPASVIPLRPRLVALYVPDVDQIGHQYGPDSIRLNAALIKVDELIGKLVNFTLIREPEANIVIVSDHGMTKADLPINLAAVLGSWRNKVVIRDRWPILMMEPLDSRGTFIEVIPLWKTPSIFSISRLFSFTDNKTNCSLISGYPIHFTIDTSAIVEHLQSQGINGAPFQVFLRENIPAFLHFRLNPRISPIVVIPSNVRLLLIYFICNESINGFRSDLALFPLLTCIPGPSISRCTRGRTPHWNAWLHSPGKSRHGCHIHWKWSIFSRQEEG
jgi:hypothetical protein